MIDKIKYFHGQVLLEIITNEGSQQYTNVAQFKLFPIKVRYNPASLPNIIYFKGVLILNDVTATMDTSKVHAMKVLLPNRNSLVFK